MISLFPADTVIYSSLYRFLVAKKQLFLRRMTPYSAHSGKHEFYSLPNVRQGMPNKNIVIPLGTAVDFAREGVNLILKEKISIGG